MLKIHKCLKLQRSIPQNGSVRHFARGGDCPMFECKRPPKEDPFKIYGQKMLEAIKPKIFECKHHKDGGLYRNIFFFVCLPLIVLDYVNIFYFEEHHAKRPKFIEFPYLRIRNKLMVFDPTGQKTLFHNPKTNALPSGYEVEVPEEDEIDPFKTPDK